MTMLVFPPTLTYPDQKVSTAASAAQIVATLAPAHRVVIQAGGCAGLWPLALATRFDTVYTFEPEPTNIACLRLNTQDRPSIVVTQAAVGDVQQFVGLTRPKAQAGLWRVEGEGTIPMVRLDDVIPDGPVDALVLDVEGSELQAWHGATRIIDTYHPLLWFEYLHPSDAMVAFLAAHDYAPQRPAIGGDAYSRYLGTGAH